MERLTDYSDDECTYIIGVGNKTCEEFCKYVVDGCKNCYIQQVFKKLADYEDLEEQGLLVRLPCKVGDTVYRVNAGAKQPIIPMTVSEIHFLCYKNERAVRFDAIGKDNNSFQLSSFTLSEKFLYISLSL